MIQAPGHTSSYFSVLHDPLLLERERTKGNKSFFWDGISRWWTVQFMPCRQCFPYQEATSKIYCLWQPLHYRLQMLGVLENSTSYF